MRALLYLKVHIWKNAILQALKKPAKLMLILFYLALFVIMMISLNFSKRVGGLQAMHNSWPQRLAAIITVLSFVSSFFALRSGRKGPNRIFSLADAQILFAAPFRPQSLLAYGLSNQLLTSILTSVFLVFQMANFYNIGLKTGQIVAVFGAWIMISMFSALLSMFSYVLCDRWARGKDLVQAYALLGLLVLLASFALVYRSGSGIDSMISTWVKLPWLRYFPLAGWIGVVLEGFLLGMSLEHWLFLVLLLLFIPLVFIYMYRQPVDFYEDAQLLVTAQQVATGKASMQDVVKAKKTTNVTFTGLGGGWGASALFYKQLLEKRRQRRRLLAFSLLGYLLLTILLVYFSIYKRAFTPSWLPLLFAAFFLFARFSLAAMNPIALELSNPNFLLFPIQASARCFYGQLAGLLFMALDILPAYLLSVIVGRLAVLPAVLLFLLLITSSMVMTAAYLLTYGIVGSQMKGLGVLSLMVIESVLLMPSIFAVLLLAFSLQANMGKGLISGIMLAMLLINLLLALLAIPAMKLIIRKGLEA